MNGERVDVGEGLFVVVGFLAAGEFETAAGELFASFNAVLGSRVPFQVGPGLDALYVEEGTSPPAVPIVLAGPVSATERTAAGAKSTPKHCPLFRCRTPKVCPHSPRPHACGRASPSRSRPFHCGLYVSCACAHRSKRTPRRSTRILALPSNVTMRKLHR